MIKILRQLDTGEGPGSGCAGKLFQRQPDGDVQGHEMGNGIAWQNEGGLIAAGRKNERFAGAQIDFFEMDLKTQRGEKFFAKIIITDARAAGKEKQIEATFAGPGFLQQNVEVIGDAFLLREFAAGLADEGGDEGAVGIANLSDLRDLGRGDEFVAGCKMDYPNGW